MQVHTSVSNCINCFSPTTFPVLNYSSKKWGYCLCIPCQRTLKLKFENSTREAITLYFCLRSRGVPAELEKFDGYTTIHIAVVPALLNIEVDQRHHVLQPKQEIVDVLQAFSTIRKGYLNLKIPNNLIRTHLEDTTDYVSQFVHISFKGN